MPSQCEDNGLGVPVSELEIVGSLTFQQFIILLGLIFTGLACMLSFYQVFQHATNYTKPHEQRQIIRICLMVPVYSLTAWFSILYFQQHVYLNGAYQLYEAFVLAAFFTLLCQYLEPNRGALKRSFNSLEIKPWFFLKPFKLCCRPGGQGVSQRPNAGLRWFNVIWLCIFQYSLIKLLSIIAIYITEAVGIYCAESSSVKYAHFWINIIQTVSLLFAMNCLIQFYIQCRKDLSPHKPILKFLAIKIVIFLLFIQTIALDAIVGSKNGPVKPSAYVAFPSLAIGVPNLILCFEMAAVAVLHVYAYPWTGYEVKNRSIKELCLQTVARTEMPDEGVTCLGSNPPMEIIELRGGLLGWRAYLDAVNFIDILHSVAKGLHWLFVPQPK